MAFLADFCVKYENQSIVFSTCTVKIFYKLLLHKLFQHPVSNSFWKEKFNIDDSDVFSKDGVHYWSLINHLKLLN